MNSVTNNADIEVAFPLTVAFWQLNPNERVAIAAVAETLVNHRRVIDGRCSGLDP